MSNLAKLDFDALVSAIRQVHDHLAAEAGKAVNISLTLRNWAIGCYIREYEQEGEDRAAYGEQLLPSLSRRLTEAGIEGAAARSLPLCRQFYTVYAEIWQTPSAKSLQSLLPERIRQSLTAKSEKPAMAISLTNGATVSSQLRIPPDRLLKSLSFSHFVELISIEDPLQRTFYEVECIRGNWSVRELKRQIGSLYYERSGLSENKEKMAKLALFVSKYQLQLPSKEELIRHLRHDWEQVVREQRATYGMVAP